MTKTFCDRCGCEWKHEPGAVYATGYRVPQEGLAIGTDQSFTFCAACWREIAHKQDPATVPASYAFAAGKGSSKHD